MTKLDRIKFSSRELAQAATIRKMAVAMAKDIRVLVIKLADRTHNIRTLGPLPEEKQRRVAQETLDVYAPLAHRLGMQEIKHEMEETCFAVLYPGPKAEIEEAVLRRSPERAADIERVIDELVEGCSPTPASTHPSPGARSTSIRSTGRWLHRGLRSRTSTT